MARPAEGGSFVFDFLKEPAAFSRPLRIVQTASPDEVPSVLASLDEARRNGFWVAGYLAYEALGAYGTRGRFSAGRPLVYFGVFRSADFRGVTSENAGVYSFQPAGTGQLRYAEAFRGLKDGLRRGDFYQVNLTERLPFYFSGDPYALYIRLRKLQAGEYSAYISHPGGEILSLSPELFLKADRTDSGWKMETRPIKGTAARSMDKREDSMRSQVLREDAKNRAENLMIVDLLRNDLGRIARPGSVSVPDLFHIESLPLVHHLVSVVRADLEDRYADSFFADALPALFPGGSITGAPKTTAMSAIEKTEADPRGIYTGIMGYAGPDSIVFNIAIRTLEIGADGKCWFGTGSGVVWDSEEEKEKRELSLKSAFLAAATDDFRLIETLRSSMGKPLRLLHHLRRLRKSARAFVIDVDWPGLFTVIGRCLPADGTSRVRITVDRNGKPEAAVSPVDVGKKPPLRVLVSGRTIASEDPYRAHKTSERKVYDEAFRDALSRGFDDVIFLNEDEHFVESAIANLLIYTRDKKWQTPPISSGALPGIFTARLMSAHEIHRSVVTGKSLSEARAVFLCNSLRGLRRVGRIEKESGDVVYEEGRESVEIKPAAETMV